MKAPFGALLYLYVGVGKFDEALAYYRDTLGCEVAWNSFAFGAHVAAVRMGAGPLVLLADHRPAPSSMPIYEVESLSKASAELKKRGWKPVGERFEVPDGPAFRFDDPSGNPYAMLQVTRPNAMMDRA